MSSPILTYYTLSPRVVAFSSTRHGGCGKGNYATFNVNKYCGDAPTDIAANHDSLCRLLGVADDHLVLPHQVHGTTVRRIDTDFFSQLPAAQTEMLEGVDALLTDLRHVCIGVSTADCIPVLLYDSVCHAACAIHAGWRGTVAGICGHAVDAMRDACGSNPSDLCAVIGPGISLDSFEVGDEVYEQFAAAGYEIQAIARQYPARLSTIHTSHSTLQTPQQKWHIDLWTCNRMQLEAKGVPSGNIHVAGICTYQHCDDYFSARKLGVASGRIITGIILK